VPHWPAITESTVYRPVRSGGGVVAGESRPSGPGSQPSSTKKTSSRSRPSQNGGVPRPTNDAVLTVPSTIGRRLYVATSANPTASTNAPRNANRPSSMLAGRRSRMSVVTSCPLPNE
jgi:hypothetical protein